METIIHFNRKSSNAKTGAIPVTTSSSNTCPKACPLKDKGCYAKTGPVSWHWNKVSKGERGDNFKALVRSIKSLNDGETWRHNVAGDLMHNEQKIDIAALVKIIKANKNKNGFTYTHHDMTSEHNQEAVAYANYAGFTINLSANNVKHADELKALNVGPVVTVLHSETKENFTTPGGNKIVVCPATLRDDVTCATCKLCARADRKSIIGFPAHGAQKRTVNEMFNNMVNDLNIGVN